MTASLTSFQAPCRWSQGAREVSRFAIAYGALAILLLVGGTPPAMAQALPNRVFADCVLNSNGQGSNTIDTLAGLVGDILATNPNNPNLDHIVTPEIAYVVIYATNNDNNGQRIEDGDDQLVGFTGPVICVNSDLVAIAPALQTDDIPDVDILDVQDALILRHAPAGAGSPGANRTCHTTDGNTDCFDID